MNQFHREAESLDRCEIDRIARRNSSQIDVNYSTKHEASKEDLEESSCETSEENFCEFIESNRERENKGDFRQKSSNRIRISTPRRTVHHAR